ncbi:MAG: hypothetical protein KC621_20985 [Myxococcales bacterium]|nr:hypothetical protein [Myxococcales bacterium]
MWIVGMASALAAPSGLDAEALAAARVRWEDVLGGRQATEWASVDGWYVQRFRDPIDEVITGSPEAPSAGECGRTRRAPAAGSARSPRRSRPL